MRAAVTREEELEFENMALGKEYGKQVWKYKNGGWYNTRTGEKWKGQDDQEDSPEEHGHK